ncbi:4-oxalocrotonate tautomerase [Rhizoctonia solani 123E]|uniref:4-oxalocrotonate tautomerase n=1 Tax=Rhizoctonia solani 123E TaxID=1423351 RepID=A0A074RKY2_9AGAM|nr:4-oxalocrotonate tautomerase [Rhizoctonia solani 123E]
MPMHRIYTASGLYSPTEKKALAEAITKIYQGLGLPAFYVVVLFIDLPEDSFYIGGETNTNFVRFNIQHIARALPDKETKLGFMKVYEAAVKPFTADKGVDWEVNIDEADPLTWNENGMSPPAPDSEGERLWIRLNKAVPFEGPAFKDRV